MTSVLKMFTAGFPETKSPEGLGFSKKCAGGRMFFHLRETGAGAGAEENVPLRPACERV
jgi:hypothetical protein